MSRKFFNLTSLAVATLVVAGCGGGGSIFWTNFHTLSLFSAFHCLCISSLTVYLAFHSPGLWRSIPLIHDRSLWFNSTECPT